MILKVIQRLLEVKERENLELAEDFICNRMTVDFSLAVTNDILFLTL